MKQADDIVATAHDRTANNAAHATSPAGAEHGR